MSYQDLHTVIVEVAGEQDAKIDTSTHGDLAHVQVQHGPAWVTCRSVETVACHAYAWATAQNEATGYLPEHLPAKKTTPRRDVAAVIIRQHGYIHPLVYQSMTSRDRNTEVEDRYLEVIVGALRTRVYDLAAARTLNQLWARAVWTAKALWADNPQIDRVQVGKLLHTRGLPAIAQEGLPPAP